MLTQTAAWPVREPPSPNAVAAQETMMMLAWHAQAKARRCNSVMPQSAGICGTARRRRRIGRKCGT
eukprot:5715366-Alexandrium_andersonii.AAC.1